MSKEYVFGNPRWAVTAAFVTMALAFVALVVTHLLAPGTGEDFIVARGATGDWLGGSLSGLGSLAGFLLMYAAFLRQEDQLRGIEEDAERRRATEARSARYQELSAGVALMESLGRLAEAQYKAFRDNLGYSVHNTIEPKSIRSDPGVQAKLREIDPPIASARKAAERGWREFGRDVRRWNSRLAGLNERERDELFLEIKEECRKRREASDLYYKLMDDAVTLDWPSFVAEQGEGPETPGEPGEPE